MSLFIPDFDETVVVRAADAELTGVGGPVTNQLLVDSPATGGALSSMRVTLGKGANGARPHHHGKSAEMFYVLDGTAQLLSGDQVVTAERGDVVVVPPGTQHAFAAAPGEIADMLVIITPGVERFEYFRHLERIRYGKVPPESLLEVQELYDSYFGTSAVWDAARG
ncbi:MULTISPECIES: cupin domain-containing protein [Streptomyces]|uniref:Cupin n=1 Tax=Streptomyces hiroshimensis TaxID=66424 RepID=A0ABQ2ZBK3_9ACTN|nr:MULTISPECIES: cupin domain-containing protein [Streptomyces]MCC3778136.1 cupin domain-containing protein [Streptomyces sp. UNOB3_S3]GGY11385.1 cupin [Streptomyces hiroshimensis]